MVFSTYDSHISLVIKEISHEKKLSIFPRISVPRYTLIGHVGPQPWTAEEHSGTWGVWTTIQGSATLNPLDPNTWGVSTLDQGFYEQLFQPTVPYGALKLKHSKGILRGQSISVYWPQTKNLIWDILYLTSNQMKVTVWRTWARDCLYQRHTQYPCRCNLTAWVWPQCQSNSWELLYDKSQ
jgi:hypothetical protein